MSSSTMRSGRSKQKVEIVLAAKDLGKTYGKVGVVMDVNMELQKGEIMGLLGPSGSGKSTLFKMLTMMEARSEGSIRVLGHDYRDRQTGAQLTQGDISIVYQDDRVLEPDLTVKQNLKIMCSLKGLNREQSSRRIAELTSML
jgi:ABC-2 type transport system ATP-binding protein